MVLYDMIYITEQIDGSLHLHTRGRGGRSRQFHGYELIDAVYEFANAYNIKGVPRWTLLPTPKRQP